MLRKLLKHDIKATSATALPMLACIAAAIIIIGCLAGGMVHFKSAQVTVFAGFSTGLLAFGVIIATVVLNVLVVTRFYTNLMTDEGYLSMTLPVTATEHICSKLLTALLFMLITVVVELVAGIISIWAAAMISGELTFATLHNALSQVFKFLGSWMNGILSQLNMEMTATIIVGILYAIFSMLFRIFSAYFAMTVAGMSKKAKIIAFLAVYFGLAFVADRLSGSIVTFVNGLSAMAILSIMTAIQIAGTVLMFFLTKNRLTKKLNLN